MTTCCEKFDSCSRDCITRLHWHDERRTQHPEAEPFPEWRVLLIRECVQQYLKNEIQGDVAIMRVAMCVYPDGKVSEADMQWAQDVLAAQSWTCPF